MSSLLPELIAAPGTTPEAVVARQPIFDRRLHVTGYELLFRGGQAGGRLVADAQGATATVALNSLTEIGIERIVGRCTAWVNVSREFVLMGLAQALPAGSVGLEILEGQRLDTRLVNELRKLKQAGYRLALDHFEYGPGTETVLDLVDVVKLDLLGLGRDGVQRQLELLGRHDVLVLAERVETHEDHRYCLDAGCHLFQGFFYCKPQLVAERGIAAGQLSMIEILTALHDPGVELAELEQLISRDVALSFRLLRYINSAFFGVRCEVRSIGQALALLGVENVRLWATLTVFASIDSKPPELTVTALIRARFCELAGQGLKHAERGELFTLGLFSVVDALMDAPIEQIVERLPFTHELRRALVRHQGQKGRLLTCLAAIESGDFAGAQSTVPRAGELYLQALVWANDIAAGLLA